MYNLYIGLTMSKSGSCGYDSEIKFVVAKRDFDDVIGTEQRKEGRDGRMAGTSCVVSLEDSVFSLKWSGISWGIT